MRAISLVMVDQKEPEKSFGIKSNVSQITVGLLVSFKLI